MSLFDTDEFGNVVTAAEHPSREVVQQLEAFGYRADAVRKWSAVKANTVLHARRKEEAIALRRAAAVAGDQDAPRKGTPTGVERLEAAAALERAMGEGPDELTQALGYTVYALTDDETRRLAGYVVKVFRGAE